MLLHLWRRWFPREPRLTGGPGSRRARTWSAESGYVYEYSFAGFRRLRQRSETVVEYVFEISGGRGPKTPLSVFLPEGQLPGWSGRDRELTASERYGIAKICMKRALDRFPDPGAMERELHPDAAEVREIADLLDL